MAATPASYLNSTARIGIGSVTLGANAGVWGPMFLGTDSVWDHKDYSAEMNYGAVPLDVTPDGTTTGGIRPGTTLKFKIPKSAAKIAGVELMFSATPTQSSALVGTFTSLVGAAPWKIIRRAAYLDSGQPQHTLEPDKLFHIMAHKLDEDTRKNMQELNGFIDGMNGTDDAGVTAYNASIGIKVPTYANIASFPSLPAIEEAKQKYPSVGNLTRAGTVVANVAAQRYYCLPLPFFWTEKPKDAKAIKAMSSDQEIEIETNTAEKYLFTNAYATADCLLDHFKLRIWQVYLPDSKLVEIQTQINHTKEGVLYKGWALEWQEANIAAGAVSEANISIKNIKGPVAYAIACKQDSVLRAQPYLSVPFKIEAFDKYDFHGADGLIWPETDLWWNVYSLTPKFSPAKLPIPYAFMPFCTSIVDLDQAVGHKDFGNIAEKELKAIIAIGAAGTVGINGLCASATACPGSLLDPIPGTAAQKTFLMIGVVHKLWHDFGGKCELAIH